MNRPFMPERDFLEYVVALCKRPKMYTATGSFNEVTAFLEGYGAGANVGEYPSHSAFTPFLSWITQKYKISETTINWDDFRNRFSSDSEALEHLPILYKEYVESLAPQD